MNLMKCYVDKNTNVYMFTRVNKIIFLIQCVSGSLLRVFVVHVHITMKIYLSGLSDRSKINPSGYPTHLYEQTVVKCGLRTAY